MIAPRRKDGGGTPLVVKEKLRNGIKKKGIEAFLLGLNGTATGDLWPLIRDPWPVEEGERLHLAGSKLSGRVAERRSTDWGGLEAEYHDPW
jgi:hypothetical protein